MAAAEAAAEALPAPTLETEEAGDAGDPPPGAVHFPLEGGPPRVSTPADDVAPGVSKQVMAHGRDEPPPTRDDKCFVHYTAWAAATGEEVDNTRDAREPAQIIVSKDVAHRAGLGAALLRMRPGERALVRVGGARAYGDAGNFSFPAVAPNAELLYDAQLIAVERAATSAEATEVRCRADMLWEERMEAAARYRDTGNAAFRGGEAQGALDAYFAGMSFIDDGMMAQLMGSYLDESSALKAALHSNAAAAALSLGRADEALAQAGAALALAPRNAKALYRKGRAHAALGQDDAARAALLRAQEVDPQDTAIRAALRDLDREEAAKAEATKKAFGGLFGAPPPPRAEPEAAFTVAPAPQLPSDSMQPAAGVVGRLGAWWRGGS